MNDGSRCDNIQGCDKRMSAFSKNPPNDYIVLVKPHPLREDVDLQKTPRQSRQWPFGGPIVFQKNSSAQQDTTLEIFTAASSDPYVVSMRASILLTSVVGLCAATDLKRSSSISQRRAAQEQPPISPTNASCPQVWFDIAADLKSNFFGCTRLAADAIRFAFHDAGERTSETPNAQCCPLLTKLARTNSRLLFQERTL